MPDSSLPPLTPPGGMPPPPPPVPSASPLSSQVNNAQPLVEEYDPADELSPFKMLNKDGKVTLPAPKFGVPVPPPGTTAWVKVDSGGRFGEPVGPRGPKIVYSNEPPTGGGSEAPSLGRALPITPLSQAGALPGGAPPPSAPVPPPPEAPRPLPTPPPQPPPVAPPPPLPSAPPPPLAPPPPSPITPPSAPKPPTGSPIDDDLDEDALVAAASKDHAQPLILPNRTLPAEAPLPTNTGAAQEEFHSPEELAAEKKLEDIKIEKRDPNEILESDLKDGPATTAQLPAFKPVPPPPPPPAPKPLPVPPPPPSKPLPSAPLPSRQLPTRPLAPLPSAVPAPALPGVPLTSTPHRRTSPALATGGIILIIVLLLGGGYVLALTGARVPVLGGLASGLPGNAVQTTSLATAFVEAHAPYQYVGLSEITVTNEKDKTLADGTPAVFKVHTENKSGIVTDKGTRFLTSATVTTNDGTAVPITLRDTGSEYLAAFPANTDTTPASLIPDNLDDTLLAPALHPVPLEVLLKAAQAERSYQKVAINGKPAASYTMGLDGSQLKDYFPAGATVETPIATIAFAWKGSGVSVAEPLDVQLTAPFTYQDRKYQFAGHWQYSAWGTQDAPSDLTSLASTDAGNIATDLTSESFVSRLGISFKALPHGTNATSGAPADTNTRFTPVIPSGDVITVVQSARPTVPAIPTQPATTEGKQRDAQRKQDLRDIQKAIEQYKLEKGSYPVVTGEIQLGTDPVLFAALVQKYLTKMPVDPLNSTYFYTYNVVIDGSGTVTGYYLRAVLEDHTDASATVGQMYHYYELTNK